MNVSQQGSLFEVINYCIRSYDKAERKVFIFFCGFEEKGQSKSYKGYWKLEDEGSLTWSKRVKLAVL